ncbi:MAG: hypothetical protein R2912_08195 [Eubacteriales bacterium]
MDTTKPVITLASGAYRIGTTTQDAISATLTYTDAEIHHHQPRISDYAVQHARRLLQNL